MSAQRHIIKRQVIELVVHDTKKAQSLQDEISRIYRQRIIPLIDKRCNEFSSPDHLNRIELLDLDIGALDTQHLEQDFIAKVDAVLSRKLAENINEQEKSANQHEGSPRTQSQLELFVYFARTGSLPWWVDSSHPGILDENLEQLLNESPTALRSLVRELLRETRPRQRMINHYTDEHLAALIGLLVPGYQAALKRDFPELLNGIQGTLPTSQHYDLRKVLWNNFMMVACLGGLQYGTLEAFYEAVLKRVATELRSTREASTIVRKRQGRRSPVGEATLLPGLHQAIQEGQIVVNSQLAEIIARLAGTFPKVLKPVSEALTIRLEELISSSGLLSEDWARLRAMLPELSTTLQARILDLLNKSTPETSEQNIAQDIHRLLQPGVIWPNKNLEGIFSSQQARLEIPPDKKTFDLGFSESDELPVGNSGLVILWPFLPHFFSRLGLLDEDRHFRDFASRQRAVGLLQVLATQDTRPPEFLLPLNKLLCGLEVSDVFEFGMPLLETEIQECADLLEAVIAQAPILHDMSVDGFRGTFLLRAGSLGTRDGFWLLRVEHQTYDIVLDRFPWNWEWVKLPWMEAPIRVEW